jgi:hypothetical protein
VSLEHLNIKYGSMPPEVHKYTIYLLVGYICGWDVMDVRREECAEVEIDFVRRQRPKATQMAKLGHKVQEGFLKIVIFSIFST